MENFNNYNILLNPVQEFEPENINESKEIKNSPLRAHVFITFLISGMSLTTVNAASNYSFENLEFAQSDSLRCTEQITKEISEYTNNLIRKSTFDKSQLLQNILSFKSLENSWDGFGALPAGVKCATNAIELLNFLDVGSIGLVSDIYPNPNGTISIEWENKDYEIVSVEIGKETFNYFVDFNSSETKFYNNQILNIESIKVLEGFISAI